MEQQSTSSPENEQFGVFVFAHARAVPQEVLNRLAAMGEAGEDAVKQIEARLKEMRSSLVLFIAVRGCPDDFKVSHVPQIFAFSLGLHSRLLNRANITLFVEPEYRRRGIGKLMVAALAKSSPLKCKVHSHNPAFDKVCKEMLTATYKRQHSMSVAEKFLAPLKSKFFKKSKISKRDVELGLIDPITGAPIDRPFDNVEQEYDNGTR